MYVRSPLPGDLVLDAMRLTGQIHFQRLKALLAVCGDGGISGKKRGG